MKAANENMTLYELCNFYFNEFIDQTQFIDSQWTSASVDIDQLNEAYRMSERAAILHELYRGLFLQAVKKVGEDQ